MKQHNICTIRHICLELVIFSIFVLTNLSAAQVPDAFAIIITVAGKEYSYQPRPDLGYVIKLPAGEQLRLLS